MTLDVRVLFLAASGLRIGEALAIKWTDFKANVLHVTRRIYEGNVDAVKSKHSDRELPIDLILMALIGSERESGCSVLRRGAP